MRTGSQGTHDTRSPDPAVHRDATGGWVAVDALEEGVIVFAVDGSPLWWNAAAERILGVPVPDFVSDATSLALITEDGRPVRAAEFPASIALREQRGIRGVVLGITKPDGVRCWITTAARPLPAPGGPGGAAVLMTFTDVTRLREAQHSADEALALLHRVFETSPVAVGITRIGPPDDGRFVLVNRAYTEIVQWPESALLEMTAVEIIHPDDVERSSRARDDLVAGRRPDDRLEVRLVRPDGSVVWCLLQRTIMRDAHGVPRFAFGQIEDLTERKAAEATMAEQALTDWLTGLPNRRLLYQRLHERLAEHPGRAGVLFVDLDGFKQVNDRYGHEVGDGALVLAAEHLAGTGGPSCLLARFGGDEFVFVLAPVDELADLNDLADRLRALEIPSGAPDGRLLRVSVGAVVAEVDEAAEHVLRRADAAMYQSKATAASRPAEARVGRPGWV